MYKDSSFLAIIPARSGSKGLPDKNIKPLCGKPLLAWSIEAALDSAYIDEVVVSTDSALYASIAKDYGANVPFLRPESLSGDKASTFDVLKHCVDYYKQEFHKSFDYIVLLEPTSPLREKNTKSHKGDVDRAIEVLLAHKSAQSIVGICATESSNPAFLVHLDNGFIRSFSNKKSEFKPLRRQDIEPVYFFEGSLYISQMDAFIQNQGFYHSLTLGYIMPKWQSLEVDDIDDFMMIEALATHYKERL